MSLRILTGRVLDAYVAEAVFGLQVVKKGSDEARTLPHQDLLKRWAIKYSAHSWGSLPRYSTDYIAALKAKCDERYTRGKAEGSLVALQSVACYFSRTTTMDCIQAQVAPPHLWCPRCKAVLEVRTLISKMEIEEKQKKESSNEQQS